LNLKLKRVTFSMVQQKIEPAKNQGLPQNKTDSAKDYLSGQKKSAPQLSSRAILQQVEAEQTKGQLTPQTQKDYNALMKSASTRVFEDKSTGTYIILKEINLGKDESVFKVFIRAKGSSEAIEAPIIYSSFFGGEGEFKIRTQSGDIHLELQKDSATLRKFDKIETNDSLDSLKVKEYQKTLSEVKGRQSKARAESATLNYRPGALTMEVHYAGRFPDGRHFFIVGPQDGYYEGWRVYLETEQGMKKLEVLDCHRLRDGGTTEVYTKEGSFYFPAPKKAGEPCFISPDRTETPINLAPRSEFDRLVKKYNIPLYHHGKLPKSPPLKFVRTI